MSNITVPVPYVPSCAYVAQSDWSQSEAQEFDLRKWNPYYRSIVPSTLAGIIVGGIFLLFLLAFLFWLCSLCCRRHTWNSRRQKYLSTPQRRSWVSSSLTAAIGLLTITTVAVGIWGLVTSLQNTNNVISDFWSIVDTGLGKVQNISSVGNTTLNNVSTLRQDLTLSSGTLANVAAAIPELQGTSVSSVLAPYERQLNSTAGTLQGVVRSGRSAVSSLQSEGVKTLQDIKRDYESESLEWQTKWRFVIFVILFVLLIILAVIAGSLGASFGAPRVTAAFVTLLWIFLIITMVVGAGILHGVFHVANDSCLYVEDFILKVANEKSTNPNVNLGIRYYIGAAYIPTDNVAQTLFGLNLTAATSTITSMSSQLFLGILGEPIVVSLVNNYAPLSAADKGRVTGIPALVSNISTGINTFQYDITAQNFQDVYGGAKEFICCRLAGIVHDLWVAWTVCSTIGIVLALLITCRIIAAAVPVSRHEMYEAKLLRTGKQAEKSAM